MKLQAKSGGRLSVRARLQPQPRAIDTPIRLTPDEIAFVRGLVIYEDAEIIVLNKPSGLSSQGGRAGVHTLDELLWAFAKSNGKRPRLVHRLDRDTSGVILTARTKPAAAFLGKAMMARRLSKTYHALIAPGGLTPSFGVIDASLRREEIGREAYMRACAPDHADAEHAVTRYLTLQEGDGAALLELSPQTGRMHQIRVHLAHIGRPILGDARYGGALALNAAPISRVMLHARALGFPHPAGGERRLAAPWPIDFASAAATAGIVLA